MKYSTKLTSDRNVTFLLKIAVSLFGLLILAGCVFLLPAGIMSDNTGYYKPILIGMYVPAIPFFMAIFQTLKLLSLIDSNQAFSEKSVLALKKIKYSAFAISGLYALGMPYIFSAADRDDAPGVVLIGLIFIGASFVIGTAAAMFQRLVANAVELKAENDLTV